MIKKIFITFFLLVTISSGQTLKFGEVKGLFMSVGVGPRFPVGDFSVSHNFGPGVNVNFSYTDNQFLPLFFYTKVEYQHYPGRQNYYQETDHSSISTNLIGLDFGVRHYSSPLVENVVLLMPVIEAGLSLAYIETLHQYKAGSGKNNSIEDIGKIGAHIGAGFSMFLMDVLAHYNYLPNHQYLSFDLRVRIPVFVTY